MEPRRIKMRVAAQTLLNFFRSVNWYCSEFHFHTPDEQIRTEPYTEVTVDGTRVSGMDDWTKTMHTSSLPRVVEKLHELSAYFLRVHVLDVSLLGRVKELPWDGQGLVRRG